jgi:RNA polymerase sigma-70 factor (ECF subfamily)
MPETLLTRITVRGAMSPDAADRRPFDEMYREYLDPVYRYCVSQTGSLSLAEDIAAETFAAAFSAYDRFRPGSAFRPWIFRIARNEVIDHRRRARRTARLAAVIFRDSRTESSSVEDLAEVRDSLRKLIAAMAALPQRERQLVGLRLAGGMSFREIAEVTATSEAAAQKATEREVWP